MRYRLLKVNENFILVNNKLHNLAIQIISKYIHKMNLHSCDTYTFLHKFVMLTKMNGRKNVTHLEPVTMGSDIDEQPTTEFR